jgi:hypothetical protein
MIQMCQTEYVMLHARYRARPCLTPQITPDRPGCIAIRPNSAKWPRRVLASMLRGRTSSSRPRCINSVDCCSAAGHPQHTLARSALPRERFRPLSSRPEVRVLRATRQRRRPADVDGMAALHLIAETLGRSRHRSSVPTAGIQVQEARTCLGAACSKSEMSCIEIASEPLLDAKTAPQGVTIAREFTVVLGVVLARMGAAGLGAVRRAAQ